MNAEILSASTATEAEAVEALAFAAAKPAILDEGMIHGYVVPEGAHVEQIDLTGPDYVAIPRRQTGTFEVHSAESLIAFLGKHGIDGETEVWADRVRARIVAVVNAGQGAGGLGGWGDHRGVFKVLPTEAWQAWKELDGKFVDQSTFAEHIENRLLDIVKPSGAHMLEIAQSISATVGVRFESSKLLSNGERQLEYRETVDASAGKAGRLDIPSHIELGIKPFEGAPAYKVTARFRYRINGGDLRLAYQLERPSDVLTEAFDAVVETVQQGVEHPVYQGVPA